MSSLITNRPSSQSLRRQIISEINSFGVCITGSTKIRVKASHLTTSNGNHTSATTQSCKLLQSEFNKNSETFALLKLKGKSVICALSTGTSKEGGVVRSCCVFTVDNTTNIKVRQTSQFHARQLSISSDINNQTSHILR